MRVSLGCCAAIGVAILSSNAVANDLSGKPCPDRDHIQGEAGATEIAIAPRGDAADFENLQWTFDNVAAGGTIKLGEGTFFLGDNKSEPKHTVIIRHGVRVEGVKSGGVWRSVIRGGGEVMGFGVTGDTLESGPFRIINEHDANPVVFDTVWIREWTCEAIYAEACHGFEFRNGRISHPVNSTKENQTKFVHALWATGSKARGDFVIENNLVEMGNYGDGKPDDEQLTGAFYCNFDNIRITNNTIFGLDEAVEIIGNRADTTALGQGPPAKGPGEIVVSNNNIKVTQNLGTRWAGTFAILVAGNKNVDAVKIENNTMDVSGKGWAFGLSGENLRVADNRIHMGEYEGVAPLGAAYIGFGMLGPYNMEPSLTNSVWTNNTFDGKARQFGILFNAGNDEMPNESRGNRFELGDSLAKLGAETTLTITKEMRGNTFVGDTGALVNQAPEGANEF